MPAPSRPAKRRRDGAGGGPKLQRLTTLRGNALHAGGAVSVRLERLEGPLVLEQGGAVARVDELRVVRADRGVQVATDDGRVCVDLVEHLFAALGGLGIHHGVKVAISGAELPLLDGGARQFVEALRAIDAPAGAAPALEVAREATLRRGRSVYRFAPDRGTVVCVEVDFPSPAGRQRASWAGGPGDFAERIAPARTFGWLSELSALRASGRARSVDLRSVLVFTEDGVLPGCRPPGPTEVARHKLLDLLGDLTLHGGPLRGSLEAFAPGHGATHAVVAEALATGVLVHRREPR